MSIADLPALLVSVRVPLRAPLKAECAPRSVFGSTVKSGAQAVPLADGGREIGSPIASPGRRSIRASRVAQAAAGTFFGQRV